MKNNRAEKGLVTTTTCVAICIDERPVDEGCETQFSPFVQSASSWCQFLLRCPAISGESHFLTDFLNFFGFIDSAVLPVIAASEGTKHEVLQGTRNRLRRESAYSIKGFEILEKAPGFGRYSVFCQYFKRKFKKVWTVVFPILSIDWNVITPIR